ncbi:hypothetical protein ACFB49_13380 [Sphingomonas sp. DBB INV C78]
MYDDIGLPQRIDRTQREKARIARACANKDDAAARVGIEQG